MRIPYLGLIAVLIIGLAAADMEPQYNSNIESSKILLSTLQKLHSSLSAQIDELSHMETTENSEKIHLLQHYTAQRNNIEREIASIQSINNSHIEVSAPRKIQKNLSAEKRSVPYLLNIFKKSRNPSQGNLTENTEQTVSSPPDDPVNGDQYQKPTKPDHPYPSNDLVEGTFPGSDPPNVNQNHHQQTFINREQQTQNYQTPPAEQVSLKIPQQYTPPHQVMIQPLAQPPQPDPQGTQLHVDPYRPQAVPQQQYQSLAQFALYRPQLELAINRPQLGAAPDLYGQALQQSPFGQKQGVFVYYPNGIDEETERPTIADRFGQAFDRFGQVISSLTNRQTLRTPLYSTNAGGTSPNRARSNNEKLKLKPMMSTDKSMTPIDILIMPSDSPMMATHRPMMPMDRPMMTSVKKMMPMAKPKMLWVSV